MGWLSKLNEGLSKVNDGLQTFSHGGIEDNARKFASMISAESLTCNSCGSLAIPLFETNNKYRCKKCGRQFSQSNHNISKKMHQRLCESGSSITPAADYVRRIYDAAVEKI